MRSLTSRSLTRGYRGALFAAALLVVAPGVWAQAQKAPAPAHDAPSPADLEPGVNTSAPPPPDTAPARAPAAAPAPKATATSKPSVASKPSAAKAEQSKTDMAPKADTPTADGKSDADTRTAKSTADGAKKPGGKAEDHLQLDTTQITGNQELPKVLYIVPWKRSDLGDLLGKPANSLLDEVLEPVDRDVFRRENRYYDALKPDAGSSGTAAGHAAGDKH
jgi:cytoskeletal protein RodZ